LEDTWKHILEDKQQYYSFLAMIMPLAKSPFSREEASKLKNYAKDIEKYILKLTPWKTKTSGMRERLKKLGVKPGEVAVLLGPGEPANLDLYKGARVIRAE
jgi:hypothetical protein